MLRAYRQDKSNRDHTNYLLSYSGPLIFLCDGLKRHPCPCGAHLGPECNHLIQHQSVAAVWSRRHTSLLLTCLSEQLWPLPQTANYRQCFSREQCFRPPAVNTATVWGKKSWQAATVLIRLSETPRRWTICSLFGAITSLSTHTHCWMAASFWDI